LFSFAVAAHLYPLIWLAGVVCLVYKIFYIHLIFVIGHLSFF
jgi:fatty acid desaturase